MFVLSPPNVLAETYVVRGADVNASDDNPGSDLQPLKTIQRAAWLAQPGDTVRVHAGVYRERVAPARGGTREEPIVYMAAPGEEVVVKGSDIWKPSWRKIDDSLPIYAGTLDAVDFPDQRLQAYRTRLLGMPDGSSLTLGQVFIDGQAYREVDNPQVLAAAPASWLVNDDGREISIHFLPNDKLPSQRLVEITTRSRIFAPLQRGLGYIHVRGFTLEHCANQFPERFWQSDSPQAGALGCRAGHHWLIEGNTVRFAKSIGIDCGYEGPRDLEGNQSTPQNTGFHVIRNNRVTDNGCCGIAGMRSIGTQIVGNVIERNNWNRHSSPEVGGIKVHYFIDGLIEGNQIRDNDAYGIWLDNVYRNARIRQNLVVGNRGAAVFVELGQGPVLIDNNVLANTRTDFDQQDPRAEGLYTHDASGVLFVHNLVFGCQGFGALHRKMSNRKGAGVSNIVLQNNIFVDNRAGHINLPYPGPDAMDNRVENNLFSPSGEYLVNPWGGTQADQMIADVAAITAERPRLWNNVSPQLNLEDWERITPRWRGNMEAESAQASISPELELVLELKVAKGQWRATPGVEAASDYFAEPLTAQKALVGPFQRIAAGKNVFALWPRSSH